MAERDISKSLEKLVVKMERTSIVELPEVRNDYCRVCCVNFVNDGEYKKHIYGKLHAARTAVGSMDRCEKCKVNYTSESQRAEHLLGVGHLRVATGEYRCELCEVGCSGKLDLDAHLKGSKHRKKMGSELWFCETCIIQCDSIVKLSQHLAGKAHAKKMEEFENELGVAKWEKLIEHDRIKCEGCGMYVMQVRVKSHKKRCIGKSTSL